MYLSSAGNPRGCLVPSHIVVCYLIFHTVGCHVNRLVHKRILSATFIVSFFPQRPIKPIFNRLLQSMTH